MASAASPPLYASGRHRRSNLHNGRRIVLGTLIGAAVCTFALATVSAIAFGLLRHSTVATETETSARPANVFADASSWQIASAPGQVGRKAQLVMIAEMVPPPRPMPKPQPSAQPAPQVAHRAVTKPPPAIAPATSRPAIQAIGRATAQPPEPEPELPAAMAFAPPEPPTRGVDVTGSVQSYTLASANPVTERPPVAKLELPPQLMPKPRPPQQQLAALTPADMPAAKPAHPPRTAIYDITTKTVYLPNGVRLEAHSGYGPYMDDPKNAHRKNRGPTPPNIYRLTLRERLFHGVQAIRMTPEDESLMFNRDGILAHSYLLGPSGQSHGCVSFRDYPRFLQAYLNGEIDRMIVVARRDDLPAAVARLATLPPIAARAERRPIVATRAERRPAASVRPDVFPSHRVF